MKKLISISDDKNSIEVYEYDDNSDVAITIFSDDGVSGSGIRLGPIDTFALAKALTSN